MKAVNQPIRKKERGFFHQSDLRQHSAQPECRQSDQILHQHFIQDQSKDLPEESDQLSRHPEIFRQISDRQCLTECYRR